MDQTWLGRNGGFGPTSFPLFQGGRRGGFPELVNSSSCMISLLAIGTGQPATAAGKTLIGVSFRAKSVKVRSLALIDRDANDP
jgi:hypothetical protein